MAYNVPAETNIFNILKQATQCLISHDITEAKTDAEVLLCGVLNITRNKLITLRQETLSQEQYKKYQKYINRRIIREPVAYILGKTEFMGLQFKVDNTVLIPRQETELIVDLANDIIKKNNISTVLDLCTGSGCIAVSIAKYNPNILVTSVDISSKALSIAKENALINEVSQQINFIESNMFNNIVGKKFDIIISNPPYVMLDEYKKLEKEIFFEPKIAFLAGTDGLDFYRVIAKKVKYFLNENGVLLLELNANISLQIVDLFRKFIFTKIKKDYSGLDRILIVQNG